MNVKYSFARCVCANTVSMNLPLESIILMAQCSWTGGMPHSMPPQPIGCRDLPDARIRQVQECVSVNIYV